MFVQYVTQGTLQGCKTMKVDNEFLDDDANLDELQAYSARIDMYTKASSIMEQMKTNPNYYLSINNRKVLKGYLADYEKSMEYVV